jgi:hypothetical protein
VGQAQVPNRVIRNGTHQFHFSLSILFARTNAIHRITAYERLRTVAIQSFISILISFLPQEDRVND